MRAFTQLVLALLLVLPLLGAAPAAAQDAEPNVTVVRTTGGIPHITGEDFYSVGYGYGRVFAEDNFCEMMEWYITIRGERSKYWGEDGEYRWLPVRQFGPKDNLKSDLFFARIREKGIVEEFISLDPPQGPLPDLQAGVEGYVAGWNSWLADQGGADGIGDPRCQGAEWVSEITPLDVYSYFYRELLVASSGVFLHSIVDAQPPTPGFTFPSDAQRRAAIIADGGESLPGSHNLDIGSNAYGVGGDSTQTGRGMVLGNPHFPWELNERFYQAHLTIPGEVDMAGASLLGVPVLNIGFNADVAWSHTVSTAYRFTLYELALVPGSPTTYLTEDGPRSMEATEVTVEALTADGELVERTHTFYDSHFGPMLSNFQVEGVDIVPWTPAVAYGIRDANAEQFRSLNQFFAMNFAQNVRDLKEAQDTYQGIPWVNTMAADSTGEAYYADHSVVPNVTDEQAANCIATTATGQVVNDTLPGLYVMDGRRSACEWGTDEDSIGANTFGPGNLPHLFTRDFVHNANDSYWLSNPNEPLTGFDRIVGDEGTERTLRTRMGLVQLQERLEGTDGLDPDPGMTLEALEEMLYGNRALSTELALEGVTARCREEADLPTEACDALEAFSGRYDVDQPGALLWRRFWEHLDAAGGPSWGTPFDAEDPVNTPRDFDASTAEVGDALAAAIADLDAASIPYDELWGTSQWVERDGQRLPVPGTTGDLLGSFNYVLSDWTDGEGLSEVYYGTSHVQAVAFNGTPCPDASTILTYSQSTNPESPFSGDQTQLFATEQWIDFPFCAEEIAADPGYEVVLGEVEEPVPGETETARVAGNDRIATAIEVAGRTHPDGIVTDGDGTATAVLAQAGDFADALAGGPLAASLGGPLLVTPTDHLDVRVTRELRRLGVDEVVLLGGDASLAPAVESALGNEGWDTRRIAGTTRYDTARLVAEELPGTAAYLVSGDAFADAISASSRAAGEGVPILLTSRDQLPAPTADALDGRTTVSVVGGTAVVSDAVVAELDGDVTRFAGATRYETAASLLPDGPVGELWIATGADWPDALSAGPAAAAAGAPLLIVDPAACDGGAGDAIDALQPELIVAVGGEQALPPGVLDYLAGRPAVC